MYRAARQMLPLARSSSGSPRKCSGLTRGMHSLMLRGMKTINALAVRKELGAVLDSLAAGGAPRLPYLMVVSIR